MTLWKPSTVGESFYFFVHEHVGQKVHVELKVGSDRVGGIPFENLDAPFTMWVGHLATSQIIARAIRFAKAHWNADDDVSKRALAIREYARDRLGLTSALIDVDEFGRLCELALQSCLQKSLTVAQAAVIYDAWIDSKCYLCGESMSKDGDTKLRPTLDHIWPRSLGGDTTEENLVPSCSDCNHKKGDLYSWPWGPVHSYFRRGSKIEQDKGQAWLWQPLHLREIMTFATKNMTSLKSAALEIGPKSSWRTTDDFGVAHFFNISTVASTV